MIWRLAQVAFGGALGAAARVGMRAGAIRLPGTGLTQGTLAANVFGFFAMGILAALLAEGELMCATPLLLAGFLGAFTTFSACSVDALALWQDGPHLQSFGDAGGAVYASLATLIVGAALAREAAA